MERDNGELHIQPATHTTVTTTTTRTTITYPPVSIPRVPSPLIPPVDAKLYPLASRRPDDLLPTRLRLRVGHQTASLNLFPTIDTADVKPEQIKLEHPQSPTQAPPKRQLPSSGRSPPDGTLSPPQKRRKAAIELPSPHLSPLPAPASPTPSNLAFDDTPLDTLSFDLNHSPDLSLLMTLPNVVSSFSNLSSDIQYHVLTALLRRCPVPVLQSTSLFIAPGLRRDFLSDLPPELSFQILGFLDSQTLCRCASVCKNWKRLVDSQGNVWKDRLIDEGLWIGHGTEEREAAGSSNAQDSRSHRRATTICNSDEDLDDATFLRLWESATWDIDFDLEEASKPTSEKLANIKHTPKKMSKLSGQKLPKLSGSSSYSHDLVNGVHPLKNVFKARFLNRRNWFSKEPKRTVFTCPGSHVETCLQFDKDRIVSASDDRVINVFSTKTGKTIQQLSGHEGGVWALEYIGDTLVSGSTDRTVRIWDLSRGVCTHAFVGHTSTVRCLQIVRPRNVNPDPNGTPVWEPPYPLIITGSRDWTVRVWKLPYPPRDSTYPPYVPLSPSEDATEPASNPYHVQILSGHKQPVRAIAAHGRLVVSGSYDHDVRVWDCLSGECTRRLVGHTEKVYSVVLDASKRRCASGSMDGCVRVWNIDDGTCSALIGHAALVGLLGLSPNYLVSAGADSHLRVWDVDSSLCKHTLATLHQGAITCFQHDEQKVLSGADGSLKLWDIRKGTFVRDLLSGLTGVWQVAYNDRFCVAAVQRSNTSEFHVLDFGDNSPSSSSSLNDDSFSDSRIFEIKKEEEAEELGVLADLVERPGNTSSTLL